MKSAVADLTAIFTELFARTPEQARQVDSGFLGDAEDELDKLFGS
jgi:hypothetical protein